MGFLCWSSRSTTSCPAPASASSGHDPDAGRSGRRGPGVPQAVQADRTVFSRERAEILQKTARWTMVEDSGRGWRKVVPSPKPRQVRGVEIAAALINRGHIVIAGGAEGFRGRHRRGEVRGVEAVIDKDYAASMLAASLSATLHHPDGRRPVQKDLRQADQASSPRSTCRPRGPSSRRGSSLPGALGPKIDAAIRFVDAAATKCSSRGGIAVRGSRRQDRHHHSAETMSEAAEPAEGRRSFGQSWPLYAAGALVLAALLAVVRLLHRVLRGERRKPGPPPRP